MKISLADRFQADVRALSAAGRDQVFDVLLALPAAFRESSRHSGLGLRKIHPSGIWEARLGLGLRIVLALGRDEAVLLRVADHDEVQRYLRSL